MLSAKSSYCLPPGRSNKDALDTIKKKHRWQRDYARRYLRNFENHMFMLCSPRVPVGFLTEAFSKIRSLELVINQDCTSAMTELRRLAEQQTKNVGNDFFRALQIVEHARRRE